MSKDRPISGIVSIALFLISACLLFIVPVFAPVKSSHHLPTLIALLVLSFNAPIVLSWIGFGMVTGIAVSLFAVVAALAGVLRSGSYSPAVLVWTFLFAAAAGYRHCKLTYNLRHSSDLTLEKLEEESNILSDTARKMENEIKHLEDKLTRYIVLKGVAETFSTTLVLEDIAKLIIEKASKTFKKPGRILLFLVDVEKQELMLSASQGAAVKVKAKKGDIFDRWVLKHSIPLIVEDVAKDYRFPTTDTKSAREHFKSLIITPLLSANKVIGILRMDSAAEDTYSQDDLRLLDIIGDLGAVAIQNALLFSWVQDLAIRDSLTGLYVRRYFMKRFREEIDRQGRNGEELSLLMLDIDRFKWYNDKFGHATGDLVLRHIAARITAPLKEGDMAARYGGEEIAIVLVGAGKAKAEKIAESIRKNIEDEPLSVRRVRHSVTVSIGISTYPQDAVTEEELVKIADERLYRAKNLGRNRTCAD